MISEEYSVMDPLQILGILIISSFSSVILVAVLVVLAGISLYLALGFLAFLLSYGVVRE